MHKQTLGLNRRAFTHLLVITVLVVLVFYAIGLYLNDVGIATVQTDLQTAMDMETTYIATQINRDVERLMAQCLELSSEKTLLRYAITNSTLSDYQRIASVTNLSDRLLRIKRFSDLVESAEIYLPRIQRVVVTDKTIYNTMNQQSWETFSGLLGTNSQRIVEHQGSAYLLCGLPSHDGLVYLISVSISPQHLLKRMQTMTSDSSLEMVLLREDGTPFVGTEKGKRLLDQQLSGSLFALQHDYFVSSAPLPSLGLILHCFKPAEETMQPVLRHRQWVWMLTGLVAVLLISYLLYYRFAILKPYQTILNSIHQAEKTGHFHIDSTDADFDDLYTQFNHMMEHMESLTAQVYEEQLRSKQAEIRQLQMQINPHFFYNTLFLVYRMAQAEGSETIAQVSLNLSNYYRYITKLPEHDVPLRDEVKHVQNYLEIQRIRFAPRVHVHMDDLPEEIANETIPPLILQPVVENAFVHGVKNKVSGGVVAVGFHLDEDHFGITVYDNGGTMDEASVHALDERIRNGQLPEGSALYNLYRRLELCYGSRYELCLQSEQDGLRVSILFPRKKGGMSCIPY